MRRLSYLLLSLLLFLSCAKEGEMDGQWDGPVIELTLSCDELGMTKAGLNGVQDGDDDYFENVVKYVDFYFYPVTANGKGRENKHPFHIPVTLTNNVLSFRLQVTSNQVNNLIFSTEECEVFALVNGPREKLEVLEDLSLDSIYSVVETTDFEKKTTSFNHRQSQFMMSGLEKMTLSPEGGRTAKVVARKIIPVARYACKLTVGIKVDDLVAVDTGRTQEDEQTGTEVPIKEYWKPSLEEMYIYLVDGVKSVTLDGDPVDTDMAPASEGGHPVHFSYLDNAMYFFDSENSYKQIFDKDGDYYTTYPSYTYPQFWTSSNKNVPYLKLVLPWVRVSDNVKKVCYYKIIIPQNTQKGVPEGKNAFLRNNWYRYNIAVGMLGADTDDAAVTVDPIDFFIYYWQDKNVVVKHASIGNARYLSVDKEYKESDNPEDQKYYVLNNESGVDITFTSSHPVSVDILSVTRPYYGKNPETKVDSKDETFKATVRKSNGPENPSKEHYYADKLYAKDTYYLEYKTEAVSGYTDASQWFTKYASYIRFEHSLNNNYTQASFDYSPYTLFLSLHHADDPSTSKEYSKIVKIVHNPAVYIEAEMNSDPPKEGIDPSKYAGRDGGSSQNQLAWTYFAHRGYVFLDGGPRMRHESEDNADNNGLYGKLMKKLNPGWGGGDLPTDNANRRKLEWMQWRVVNFTGGNRNLYNIVVTVLPSGSPYCIGDPRTPEPTTWNNGEEAYSTMEESKAEENRRLYYNYNFDTEEADNAYVSYFQEGDALYGDSPRNLAYYFPAESSSRTANMLAPSCRVASKFGGVEYGGITQRSAEFKCATYQEDGYPAGRWRLPTQAEITFIADLTNSGSFNVLFESDKFYWSSNGAVKPKSGLNKDEKYALARCVYDSWYWDPLNDRLPVPPTNDSDREAGRFYRDQYVLGDMPR